MSGFGRIEQAVSLREQLAKRYLDIPNPSQMNNGDDNEYEDQNYFASYTKGLPHNGPLGEVDPNAYKALLTAVNSGRPADFAAIPLGWPVAGSTLPMDTPGQMLTDPQAGLAFDLEGIDSHQLTLRPCYRFADPGAIGEIAENYWLALARDVPFAQYGSGAGFDAAPGGGSITANAAADLSNYAVFDGPKSGGKVTVQTLFRGGNRGDLVGPYVSQFLLLDVPYGSERFEQKISYGLTGTYMVDPALWLDVQRGAKAPPAPAPIAPTYMYRGRDLANYVHIDELFQAYLNACLLMITPNARGGLQVPPNPGNPYPGSNQSGFGTLGEPNFKTLVAEVATRALKAVWYQKWFVHRRMRPETYAGRIHHQLAGTAGAAYPFDAGEFAKLNATLLPAVKAANAAVFVGGASWMLPMAFPEGSPTHPAYGAGHATVAGACVTVLKALFDTEQPIGPLVAKAQAYGGGTLTLVEPDATGTVLNPYTETGPNKLTVRGELEKLASNIGIARNFAGVHWRSDYTESLYLGERVALEFLRDTAATYNEDVSFTFRLFNGSGVTITKDAAVRGPVPA